MIKAATFFMEKMNFPFPFFGEGGFQIWVNASHPCLLFFRFFHFAAIKLVKV